MPVLPTYRSVFPGRNGHMSPLAFLSLQPEGGKDDDGSSSPGAGGADGSGEDDRERLEKEPASGKSVLEIVRDLDRKDQEELLTILNQILGRS